MYRFRTWLAALAIWLLLFYNIERLTEPINIASFVYVLVPVGMGVLLFMPRLSRGGPFASLLTVFIVAYVILKASLGYAILGANLALTVTELAAIIVTLLLMRPIVATISDFEAMIGKLTVRQIGLPPRLFDSVDTEAMYREVKRCRRFDHPLVLLQVKADVNMNDETLEKILMDIRRGVAHQYMQARLAKMLSEDLRDIDLIAQYDDGFAILLPETKREDAQALIKQLKHEAISILNTQLHVGVGAFPDEALTLSGLLDQAARDLDTHQQPINTEAVTWQTEY